LIILHLLLVFVFDSNKTAFILGRREYTALPQQFGDASAAARQHGKSLHANSHAAF
jgi:hypothetical protein